MLLVTYMFTDFIGNGCDSKIGHKIEDNREY